MFNGIVELAGTITSIEKTRGGGANLIIDAEKLATRLKAGDSIAVDGICLTTVKRKGREVYIDVSAETLRRTNLAYRVEGDRVNLELPISVGAAISGHFVQGHIEGTARVTGWVPKGEDVRLKLELPTDLTQYCIPKGSIAVNGVSLTIASLKGNRIEIALIPYTLQVTNLDGLRVGDLVNIETDMIGRYVVTTLKREYHKA